MLLRNQDKRLITVNAVVDNEVKSWDILPGENPAVEVPDKHCESDFVQNLINTGALRVMPSAAKPTGDDDEDELRKQCEELGIEVDGRWSAKRMRAEIEKALGE